MLCKDHTYVFQARQTATIDESLEIRDDEVVVLLASILKWNGKPRLTCGNVRCPPSQTRMNVLDMLESRKTTEQRHWQAKQLWQMVCIWEDLKCWGAWEAIYEQKSRDITPCIIWRGEAEKEEARDNLPCKGPERTIKPTLKLFLIQSWGNFWQTAWSAYVVFPERIDIILNGSELASKKWVCSKADSNS